MAELAPAEEPLGTQEAALDCAGASATVSLQDFTSWGGVGSGGGSWSVTYPANAVVLEYFIDGVLSGGPESLQGDSNRAGYWSFNNTVSCGSHTFMVKAYPAVYNSATQAYAKCSGTGTASQSKSFSQSCPTASLYCSRTSTWNISCSGSGGSGTLAPYWRQQILYEGGTSYAGYWFEAPSTYNFYCQEPSYQDPIDQLTISFKVRDSSGMDSAVKSASYSCAPW
ncbi:MAG TPA: hypothetical protein VE057_24720 [Archangium sp.]|nr:hypothetical protein [Archangium sp.]